MMIYFDLPARRAVLRRLHEKMRGGAWLLLGHSESLLNVTADFELVHLTSDLVYRKPRGGRGGAAVSSAPAPAGCGCSWWTTPPQPGPAASILAGRPRRRDRGPGRATARTGCGRWPAARPT